MNKSNWILNPSDFAFLWEECKRCYYLKFVSGFKRPSPPMAKIFNVIDSRMKDHFANKSTAQVLPFLPKGIVDPGGNWVQSIPLPVPGHSSTCVIRGKLDTVVRFEDGAFAVIDFKTAQTKAEHIPLYARQLQSYAIALENAAPGNLALKPVRKLGLVIFEPDRFSADTNNQASLSGSMAWVEIPRDDKSFFKFLSDVLDVLEQPEPPGGAAACEWCLYRDTSRRTKL